MFLLLRIVVCSYKSFFWKNLFSFRFIVDWIPLYPFGVKLLIIFYYCAPVCILPNAWDPIPLLSMFKLLPERLSSNWEPFGASLLRNVFWGDWKILLSGICWPASPLCSTLIRLTRCRLSLLCCLLLPFLLLGIWLPSRCFAPSGAWVCFLLSLTEWPDRVETSRILLLVSNV